MSDERSGEVTTLHVSNLPQDFSERELFLLFGPMPGFKNGLLKFVPGKTMGFVTFDTRRLAADAIERTNGLSWTGSHPEFTLRVGFAATQTRNIKSDRSIISNHSVMRAGGWPQAGPGASSAQAYSPAGDAAGAAAAYPSASNSAWAYPHQGQAPPATLYISGICDGLSDEALTHIFDRFRPVRLSRTGNKAWLCFNTPEDAAAALTQGASYTDSVQVNPLKVSFARTEMRVKTEGHAESSPHHLSM